MTGTSDPAPVLAPGRACGSCAMCCKLYGIPELDKPPAIWCVHVVTGRGCAIHETRPQTCRLFFCHWMRNPNLGPEWRPDRAKFVLTLEMEGRRMVVAPDTGAPTSWRAEPYYGQFKRWAALGAGRDHQILVFNGQRATAILPDRDVNLGIVRVGDTIVYRREGTGFTVDHRGQRA